MKGKNKYAKRSKISEAKLRQPQGSSPSITIFVAVLTAAAMLSYGISSVATTASLWQNVVKLAGLSEYWGAKKSAARWDST